MGMIFFIFFFLWMFIFFLSFLFEFSSSVFFFIVSLPEVTYPWTVSCLEYGYAWIMLTCLRKLYLARLACCPIIDVAAQHTRHFIQYIKNLSKYFNSLSLFLFFIFFFFLSHSLIIKNTQTLMEIIIINQL